MGRTPAGRRTPLDRARAPPHCRAAPAAPGLPRARIRSPFVKPLTPALHKPRPACSRPTAAHGEQQRRAAAMSAAASKGRQCGAAGCSGRCGAVEAGPDRCPCCAWARPPLTRSPRDRARRSRVTTHASLGAYVGVKSAGEGRGQGGRRSPRHHGPLGRPPTRPLPAPGPQARCSGWPSRSPRASGRRRTSRFTSAGAARGERARAPLPLPLRLRPRATRPPRSGPHSPAAPLGRRRPFGAPATVRSRACRPRAEQQPDAPPRPASPAPRARASPPPAAAAAARAGASRP
jgi:hypothetical protein